MLYRHLCFQGLWSAPAGAAANSTAQYPDRAESKVATQAMYCSVDGCQNTPVLHSSGICMHIPSRESRAKRGCSAHLLLVHVRASEVRFSSFWLKNAAFGAVADAHFTLPAHGSMLLHRGSMVRSAFIQDQR